MFEEHPDIAELAGFLRGDSGSLQTVRNQRILRHLLAECAVCTENLRAVGKSVHRLERAGYSYDNAFQRAEASLHHFLTPEVQPPEKLSNLVERLLASPLESREELVLSDGRFASPQLVDWLIEKSHEVRYSEPAEMLRCAHLAQVIASRCTPESVGNNGKLEDLQARAWRQYGNALRVAGHLQGAEEAFNVALDHLRRGTGDPVLRALHAEHLAPLYYIQRRYSEAIDQTEEAAAIFRQLGDQQALARVFVTEAIARLYSGDAEGAIGRLNQAIPLIDHATDPNLLLAACHNLVSSYIELDRPEEALALYLEIKTLYRESGDPLFRLRYFWQEGQLLRDLGQLRAAEQILQHTRACYLEKGLTVEAAEVSLDLAAVYVKLKAFEDLAETVAATAVIFRTLGMDRDALASLLQLQQVAHEEQRALKLVRSLAAQLEEVAKRAPAIRA